MNCRHCDQPLNQVFCDLNTCPPSNAMIRKDQIKKVEKYFPLKIFVCEKCWLVQVEELEKAEDIFNSDYTYFSSFSSSWLKHCENYVNQMIGRFGFNEKSLVVEIASNDGYLLQYFKHKKVPVIGIEPTENTASVAIEKGIETVIDFFGTKLANEKFAGKADLIVGNNVLAHVPDLNDFVKGVKLAMTKNGIATFEFPHLCKIVENNQFDTIYHEHFSYFSLTAIQSIFSTQGLELFDVKELSTHGGSLRIYVKHKEDNIVRVESSVNELLNHEKKLGLMDIYYYSSFQEKVNNIKYSFFEFLIDKKKNNKKVIGYGAAAKGNTLLNYCGIKGTDLISFVVDISHHKQGKLLPGSRIPVYAEAVIRETKPDYIIIFPWNITHEVVEQLSYVNEWNCKFVVVIPHLSILN